MRLHVLGHSQKTRVLRVFEARASKKWFHKVSICFHSFFIKISEHVRLVAWTIRKLNRCCKASSTRTTRFVTCGASLIGHVKDRMAKIGFFFLERAVFVVCMRVVRV
jgi:hypothetical protein